MIPMGTRFPSSILSAFTVAAFDFPAVALISYITCSSLHAGAASRLTHVDDPRQVPTMRSTGLSHRAGVVGTSTRIINNKVMSCTLDDENICSTSIPLSLLAGAQVRLRSAQLKEIRLNHYSIGCRGHALLAHYREPDNKRGQGPVFLYHHFTSKFFPLSVSTPKRGYQDPTRACPTSSPGEGGWVELGLEPAIPCAMLGHWLKHHAPICSPWRGGFPLGWRVGFASIAVQDVDG